MFAPFSSDFLQGNEPKIFSFRENVQFPPAGSPRIRKLKIFGEIKETKKYVTTHLKKFKYAVFFSNWRHQGSNLGSYAYQAYALADYAISPKV